MKIGRFKLGDKVVWLTTYLDPQKTSNKTTVIYQAKGRSYEIGDAR